SRGRPRARSARYRAGCEARGSAPARASAGIVHLRSFTGEDLVDAGADVAEVGFVAAMELGGHKAVEAHLGEGAADLGPVDAAFAQIDEAALVAAEETGPALVVLQVDLADPLSERADPVFGPGERDDVAHVEVGVHPGAAEAVHEGDELERAQEEVV